MNLINIKNRALKATADAMQYDAGRVIELMLDEDMTGKYAEYEISLSDSKVVRGHCDISTENVAFFVLPENVTAHEGTYQGQVIFYDTSELENRISAFPFDVTVTKSTWQAEDVYEVALKEVREATEAATQAAANTNQVIASAQDATEAATQAAENANSKASAANSAAQSANAAATSAQELITKMNNILDKWGDADFSAVLNIISDLQDKTSTLENWKNSVDGGTDDVMIEV